MVFFLQVPWWNPELRKKMEEMTPIFKNIQVTRDDIGETMKDFADSNKLMSTPRRCLIGSYIGNTVLLTSPLLKWLVVIAYKIDWNSFESFP